MRITKVYFDSCDSWTVNTKVLKTFAKNEEAAVKFIAQYENKSIEDAQKLLENQSYWSIEEVEVFE